MEKIKIKILNSFDLNVIESALDRQGIKYVETYVRGQNEWILEIESNVQEVI